MKASTTQPKSNQKEETKILSSENSNMTPFEVEITKKIRNKEKKLREINDLRDKAKAKDFKPTDQQKEKIAARQEVEEEIKGFKTQLSNFTSSTKEMKKHHQQELNKAKDQAVATVVNILTLATLTQCGHEMPEDIEEGVQVFSNSLNKLQCIDQESINWRKEREVFIKSLQKLVKGQSSTIQGTDISFSDLQEKAVEAIASSSYPDVIKRPQAAKVEEPVVEEAVVEEPEEVVEELPVEEPVKAESPEPVVEVKEEAPAKEATAVVEEENKDTAVEETKEEKVAPANGERERGGRGRARRERGEWRGGERGEYRGNRGGDRGDRRGGRGRRPNTAVDTEKEFVVVGEEKTRGRGRGRGGYRARGDGEYRGNFRGARGDRGGDREGGYRGGGERGFRGRRGGNRGGEKPEDDQEQQPKSQVGVENAVAQE